MLSKINWSKARYILEPSAGAAHIIKQIRESKGRFYHCDHIYSIEIDDNLRNMLIGSGERVVGKDFLTYAGLIQFDTIIMNPPFSGGDAHLLKAIEILYSGQIVCLLNAETIRNPHTNLKRDLVRKLKELEADIEFIENAFLNAERETAVEVALITIKIEREVENDLLAGAEDRATEFNPGKVDEQIKDVANSNNIEAIVDDYNFRAKMGIQTIQDFYRNRKYIGSFISLVIGSQDRSRADTLTEELKEKTNEYLEDLRHHFWNKTLSLPEFEKRLTIDKQKEFRETLKKNSDLEFTLANVRAFFENLMGSYEDTLIDAIVKLFDDMTFKYAWDESIHCKNVHYYNGWVSNSAFKINKKVIMPHIGVNPYRSFSSDRLDWDSTRKLDDIDKVMNYFDGKRKYVRISEAAAAGEDLFILHESEYFKIRFYKKGTTHLTFKSEDIRRRFNIEVGKRKGWLPMDYGHTPLKELSFEQKQVVESFEDNVKDYTANLGRVGIAPTELLMIA